MPRTWHPSARRHAEGVRRRSPRSVVAACAVVALVGTSVGACAPWGKKIVLPPPPGDVDDHVTVLRPLVDRAMPVEWDPEQVDRFDLATARRAQETQDYRVCRTWASVPEDPELVVPAPRTLKADGSVVEIHRPWPGGPPSTAERPESYRLTTLSEGRAIPDPPAPAEAATGATAPTMVTTGVAVPADGGSDVGTPPGLTVDVGAAPAAHSSSPPATSRPGTAAVTRSLEFTGVWAGRYVAEDRAHDAARPGSPDWRILLYDVETRRWSTIASRADLYPVGSQAKAQTVQVPASIGSQWLAWAVAGRVDQAECGGVCVDLFVAPSSGRGRAHAVAEGVGDVVVTEGRMVFASDPVSREGGADHAYRVVSWSGPDRRRVVASGRAHNGERVGALAADRGTAAWIVESTGAQGAASGEAPVLYAETAGGHRWAGTVQGVGPCDMDVSGNHLAWTCTEDPAVHVLDLTSGAILDVASVPWSTQVALAGDHLLATGADTRPAAAPSYQPVPSRLLHLS